MTVQDEIRDAAMQSMRQAPLPLCSERRMAAPYPAHALGKTLSDACAVMAEAVQCPVALVAQSLLSGAALAVQGHANVVNDGRVEPVSLTLLSVAASGERKSAADSIAMGPHKRWQQKAMQQHKTDLEHWRNALKAWSIDERKILKAGESGKFGGTLEDELADLGPAPDPPTRPIVITGDPTIEGLHKSFLLGRPSQGLISAEGGSFFGGHANRSENKQRTAAMLSNLHDGSEIERTRAGDGESYMLYDRRLTTHLMMQPGVAGKVLTDPVYRDQGYLARCLTVWPTSAQGLREYKYIDAGASPAVQAYQARVEALMDTELGENEHGDPVLRLLQMDAAAKQVWIELYNWTEKQLGPGCKLEPVRAFSSKLPSNALRIAGVLTLFENLNAEHITADAMNRAAELAEYYLDEEMRILGATESDQPIENAVKMLEWLHRHTAQDRLGGEMPAGYISMTEVLKSAPRSIAGRKRAATLEVMQTLEAHHWALPVQQGIIVNGRIRKQCWEVVKNDPDTAEFL